MKLACGGQVVACPEVDGEELSDDDQEPFKETVSLNIKEMQEADGHKPEEAEEDEDWYGTPFPLERVLQDYGWEERQPTEAQVYLRAWGLTPEWLYGTSKARSSFQK